MESDTQHLAATTLIPVLLVMAVACASAQVNRIGDAVDLNRTVAVRGAVSPLAQARYDQGRLAPSFELPYVVLMLEPDSAQQAALRQLLADQADLSSPRYRHWLTPEEYADRFGLSPSDFGRIRAWLEGAGFKIEHTARGRDWIAFGGTAAQVQAAFHTEVHRYLFNNVAHFSISSEPRFPAALAPVVAGIKGLHDFYARSPRHFETSLSAGPGQGALVPADLATIYNIRQLGELGTDGTGQSIAILGQTELVLNDIQGFRSTFGLSDQNIQTIETGIDPGVNSEALGEADLDLEWAGAVAPNASLIYVYSTDALDAAIYAIDQNLAPVISDSFGQCEASVPASLVSAYESQAQKASSMGITWLASSGDTGAAGCDSGATPSAALGLNVMFPASITEVTAVGGSEFNEGAGEYWGTSANSFGGMALSYIPEIAWNDTDYGVGLSASGGGVSVLYPKPTWQAGAGVPDDGARDVPDVAMDGGAMIRTTS